MPLTALSQKYIIQSFWEMVQWLEFIPKKFPFQIKSLRNVLLSHSSAVHAGQYKLKLIATELEEWEPEAAKIPKTFN